MTPPVDLLAGPGRGLLVLADREGFVGADQIDEMVGHLRLFGGAGFGGADVHAPVDLHGVRAEQFHVAGQAGHGQGQGALGASGGAHDHQRRARKHRRRGGRWHGGRLGQAGG